MNDFNSSRLLSTYPLLYRKLREFGFECGDGWFDLIWQLSADIESAAHLKNIPETLEAWPAVTILKQKFGSLRLSFSEEVALSEDICSLVDKACEHSRRTCESCGAPANMCPSPRPGGWVRTLCTNCRNELPPPPSDHNPIPKPPIWVLEKKEEQDK